MHLHLGPLAAPLNLLLQIMTLSWMHVDKYSLICLFKLNFSTFLRILSKRPRDRLATGINHTSLGTNKLNDRLVCGC